MPLLLEVKIAKNKKWSTTAKFEIALAAVKSDRTINEICEKYQVSASQVHAWKKQLLEDGKSIFDKSTVKTSAKKAEEKRQQETRLYETIGQLTVERDFLKKKLGQATWDDQRRLIDQDSQEISVRQQCELLQVNRSSLYYKEKPPSLEDADLLNLIRDVWQRYNLFGYRRITRELKGQGVLVNRKCVQRLMNKAGIKALFPGPNTSQRNKDHAVYPYLIRDLKITRPDQVWMTDLTYLRMPKGFIVFGCAN